MMQRLEYLDIYMYESSQRVFRHPWTNTDGYFRLLLVDPLLYGRGSSALHVTHFYMPNDWAHVPRYAAISHVWDSSDEVLEAASTANRPLFVDTGDKQPKDISWHGLQQAATVAKHMGCEYIWLDFVCLNQLSSKDKKIQIANMGEIYKHATAVLIMVGGVQAAHDLHSGSKWIDRAWTLQEATLNQYAYVIMQWDKGGTGRLEKDGEEVCWIRKMEGDIGYAPLIHLLGMVGKPPKLDIVADFGVFYAKDEKDGSDEDSDGEDDDESDDDSDLNVEDVFKSAWGGFKDVAKEAAEEGAGEAA